MSEQQSIHDILKAALQEIRQQHGFAAYTIRAEWIGTAGRPSIAVTCIQIEGSAHAALAQEES